MGGPPLSGPKKLPRGAGFERRLRAYLSARPTSSDGKSVRFRSWMVAGPALFGGLLALALLPGPAAATFPPNAVINQPINGSAFDANSTILFIANDTSDPDENSTLTFIWNFSGPIIQGIELRVVAYWNFTI